MSKIKVKRLNSVLSIEEADLKKYEARGFKTFVKKTKGEAKGKGDGERKGEAKGKGDGERKDKDAPVNANEGKKNQ